MKYWKVSLINAVGIVKPHDKWLVECETPQEACDTIRKLLIGHIDLNYWEITADVLEYETFAGKRIATL